MPRNKDIKKVLVIGSGPIVIGQAAEFDYAGTQACRSLKEEGVEVVLVNSNPATIMTDSAIADHVYIEPLTLEFVKRIIEKEKPDSILSTLGGQTGLTLSMELAKEGFLKSHNVTLLGASPETIDKAEDRQCFKDTMEAIGEPVIPSKVVTTIEDALDFAEVISYPVIVRPAFTLGGTGGGIAANKEELYNIAEAGIRLSPINQILVEKCISGWKEIEFEVMRDAIGNEITVCSMENFDPVGVHTGDSIVIAPAVTLADKEYQMLRSAALNIIQAMGIEGGCNCQFALNPESFEYAVIEVNPRVSRSSALASKATGYPIARVATKIAIGYHLDEIPNEVTGETMACFEPALDYVTVKFPKWPFDKFVYGRRKLGTQMKAVRGAEISQNSLNMKKLAPMSVEELREKILAQDDERLFAIYESFKRGVTVAEIHELTKIDEWFLNKLMHILSLERRMQSETLSDALYMEAKQNGFPDAVIKEMTGLSEIKHVPACYRMVDTCSAEFTASTPYFYSTFGEEDEAEEFIKENASGKPVVMVFGSGPIRIGQGIEFDFASVHCVWSLKRAGYEVVIVNNNPETVSTDFNVADRLYFEPLTPEDVLDIIRIEKPIGAVVAFGGQTAIRLTKCLVENNIPVLGTPADSIDMAEDRGRFAALLKKLNMKQAAGQTVYTEDEAIQAANHLGYPVLMRPSYVLGGQNMIIAYNDADIHEYMKIILSHKIENAILIDKYLMGKEIEVDAVCDGEDILIPGIMEHIERAGIHSGDSISVYPAKTISEKAKETIAEYTRRLARALHVIGMINIQFIVLGDDVYVIEVNPRSSRTVPYISKVTGIPIVPLATKVILGYKLKDMGYEPGLQPEAKHYAIKMPVFSFEKIRGADISLGPEMKSTGECLGIAETFNEALYKAFIGAGIRLPKHKNMIITVKDEDKQDIIPIARRFEALGYRIYATLGTAKVLKENGIKVIRTNKLEQPAPNLMDLILGHKIDVVIDTPPQGVEHQKDGFVIRRNAIETGVNVLTSLDTAEALATSLENTDLNNLSLIDIATIARR